jgi:hypothetical protein
MYINFSNSLLRGWAISALLHVIVDDGKLLLQLLVAIALSSFPWTSYSKM